MKIVGWGGSVNTTSKSTHGIKKERTKNFQRESKCSSVSSLIAKGKICCIGLKKPFSSEFKQTKAGSIEKSGEIKVSKIGNSLIWAKTRINLKGLGCDVTRWCVKGKNGRGGKIQEMLRFKIYHEKTKWVKNKIRADRGRQIKSEEVKMNKEDKNPGKIYKSIKPPRRRVHTCSVEYDRVQAEKSVHSQYSYSKEAWCKVDSENLSGEKPKSHRTKKSGKTVSIISVKNCVTRISGMVVKCKNYSNAKYRMSNVKKVSIVTLKTTTMGIFVD
jgi:hypothetical protein